MTAPPLSVVIPTRRPFSSLGHLLDAVVPEVVAVGGEVIVVGGTAEEGTPSRPGVRFVPVDDANIMRLRADAFAETNGDVIAVGEDHAYPMAGWAEAVLRAHAEHPDVPVVLGCLVNTTNRTAAARANFLAFAAPFAPPMLTVPTRPPPVSVVSIKRDALADARGVPGALETALLPELFLEGKMVIDDRILVDHRQPFGLVKAMRNAFAVARASYGYARPSWSRREQHASARWALTRIAPRVMREARFERARAHSPRRDLLVVALIAMAMASGATIGSLIGPGRAALRSA
jgi:hypothetical protein